MSKEAKTGRLDPWIMRRIKRTMKEGITYSVNWRDWPEGPAATTAIHWRPPVDPSATLARAIIDKVTQHTSPMPMELDGHLFLIQRVDGHLVPNERGGMDFQPYVPRKDRKKGKKEKK